MMDGTTAAVRAVLAAAPTSRHAEFLFDAVRSQLGERAWIEHGEGGTARRLFRRDDGRPELIKPWPLLKLRHGARVVLDMGLTDPMLEPPLPPRPERKVPRLRGLHPGELEICNGPERIDVAYGENGGWSEACRSSGLDPLGTLAGPASAPGNRVDELARRIAELATPENDRGRVLLPVPLPMGVTGVWLVGLRALRRALFQGKLGDAETRFAMADGFAGQALAHGTTYEQALARWRQAVDAIRPAPPRPNAEPEPPPPEIEGAILLRSPGPPNDVPWPKSTPTNTPAACIELPPLPAAPPSTGAWVRLVGAYGHITHAALRHEPEGFTLFGEQVLPSLDPERIEAPLAAAEARQARLLAEIERRPDRPSFDCRVAVYRLMDEQTRKPVTPTVEQSHERNGFDAGDLDGDTLAWRVVRQRWLR